MQTLFPQLQAALRASFNWSRAYLSCIYRVLQKEVFFLNSFPFSHHDGELIPRWKLSSVPYSTPPKIICYQHVPPTPSSNQLQHIPTIGIIEMRVARPSPRQVPNHGNSRECNLHLPPPRSTENLSIFLYRNFYVDPLFHFCV